MVPPRPPVVQACVNGQDVSLSLEAYTDLHRLLVKGTDSVQPVSPLECGLYKVSDIKQVLQVLAGKTSGVALQQVCILFTGHLQVLLLHGLSAGGKKQELLNKMAGMSLYPPACDACQVTQSLLLLQPPCLCCPQTHGIV